MCEINSKVVEAMQMYHNLMKETPAPYGYKSQPAVAPINYGFQVTAKTMCTQDWCAAVIMMKKKYYLKMCYYHVSMICVFGCLFANGKWETDNFKPYDSCIWIVILTKSK